MNHRTTVFSVLKLTMNQRSGVDRSHQHMPWGTAQHSSMTSQQVPWVSAQPCIDQGLKWLQRRCLHRCHTSLSEELMQPKCPQRHLRCLHRNNTQHVGPPKTHNLSATGSEAAQAVLVIAGALSFSAWVFNVANRMANRNLSYPPNHPAHPAQPCEP
jgi:hypothetical protein